MSQEASNLAHAIWASVLVAIVAMIVIAAVTVDGHNNHSRTQIRVACIQSGQSLIDGNCVSGKVVKP